MTKCIECKKKIGLYLRVNNEGIPFCSDECYEGVDNSPDDRDHPYIDDYDAIRWEYIACTNQYDSEAGEEEIEALQERIESALDEFWEYTALEGGDGVFSREIYRYYWQELEELGERIRLG
ncbi:hypothetical protein ANABIO32_23760 [Rossellomorea marisflavi]|uniref:hypothetical protein n=1 Tax=Rossellomorea marisflavi TaxID=189381 RepID=UPI0025C99FAD|nr:hypothetical protein [Rossellomorea marisflavi]GLI84665.1 hypothetical protein ANABIO32_23760 [Rossellomorea marisflavi]